MGIMADNLKPFAPAVKCYTYDKPPPLCPGCGKPLISSQSKADGICGMCARLTSKKDEGEG